LHSPRALTEHLQVLPEEEAYKSSVLRLTWYLHKQNHHSGMVNILGVLPESMNTSAIDWRVRECIKDVMTYMIYHL